MSGVEATEADLRTAWFGFRFRDPETERRYRRWYVGEAIFFVRVGAVASTAALIGVFLAAWSRGWHRDAAPWIFLGTIPPFAVAYTTTLRQSWSRFVLPCAIVANTLAGLLLVWPITSAIAAEPVGVALAATVTGFFALTVFRLHPGQAALGAFTYISLAQVVLLRFHSRGELTVDTTVVGSTGLWLGFGVGGRGGQPGHGAPLTT